MKILQRCYVIVLIRAKIRKVQDIQFIQLNCSRSGICTRAGSAGYLIMEKVLIYQMRTVFFNTQNPYVASTWDMFP